MPSSYTPNYELNQWKKTDKVLMEDFNADNAKLDEAIGALAEQVDQKADQTALTEETGARTSAVNTINTTLAKKGNCEIWTTTYTGNGKNGSGNPNKLTFTKQPALVVIFSPSERFVFFAPGTGTGFTPNSNNGYSLNVSWSGATMSWHSGDAGVQLNTNGYTYRVVAFIKQS